ncbi:hypothetical protein STEG23_036410, partial [Scotinomys teguina]
TGGWLGKGVTSRVVEEDVLRKDSMAVVRTTASHQLTFHDRGFEGKKRKKGGRKHGLCSFVILMGAALPPLGNFAKATFDAISKTYSYLTPDLWKETVFTKSPYQEFTDHLVKTHTRVSVQRTQAPAVATT